MSSIAVRVSHLLSPIVHTQYSDRMNPDAPNSTLSAGPMIAYARVAKNSLDKLPEAVKDLVLLSSDGEWLEIGRLAIIARHARGDAKLLPRPCFIHRLPNELLCAIFILCGDPSARFVYPRDQNMHAVDIHCLKAHHYIRGAMIIRYVCSRWKTVASNYPAMWTMFDVSDLQKRDIQGLQLCILHHKALPLVFQYEEDFGEPVKRPAVRQKIFQLLAQSASHWEELSIIIHDVADEFHPLVSVRSDKFSSLVRMSLVIGGKGYNTRPPPARIWRHLLSVPSLRSVELWDNPANDLHIVPGWLKRITHLGLQKIPPAHFMNILHPDAIWDAGLNVYDWLDAPALDRLEVQCSDGVQAQPLIRMLVCSSAHLSMLTLFAVSPRRDGGDITSLLLTEPDYYDPRRFLPSDACSLFTTFEKAEVAYRRLRGARSAPPFLFRKPAEYAFSDYL
ncbi:hypothetical protein HDZ31DRAFT_59562 [Schizophyllum fasciatum]